MRIVVCMAIYNGSKYLEEQLSSIMSQLSANDEIIAIDDCSTDNSVSIIENIVDPRIRLLRNKENMGILESFQKALSFADGDVIFLSDQDDIWLPSKTTKVKQIFLDNPLVTLVISDAQVIDMKGALLDASYYSCRGAYTSNIFMNIIKNKYLGCTMAFRSCLLPVILPFPQGIPMHDSWIGLVSSIYGKNFYINESLIKHRRHDSNASRGASGHANIFQMISWRLNILLNLYLLTKKYGISKEKLTMEQSSTN